MLKKHKIPGMNIYSNASDNVIGHGEFGYSSEVIQGEKNDAEGMS